MNLAETLTVRARAQPDAPALLFADSPPVSYRELEEQASRAAGALRVRGVEAGDRVGIMLPNGSAFVAALFGAWKLGAVAVPLNTLLAEPEVQARVELAEPRLLLRDEATTDAGEVVDAVSRDASDAAVVLFTSGTTGAPKGAILTHGSIAAAAANAAAAMQVGAEDVVLGAAPFSHVLGLSTCVVSTLSRGAAIAVDRRFDAERTLDLMTRQGVTIMLGVPTMCITLAEAAREAAALPPLRIAHIGGAAVPVEVAANFERTFAVAIHDGYGLTEMSGIATTYSAGEVRKPGSVGCPLGGTAIRIGDPDAAGVGEVQFRGPSVIPGYWNDEAATAAAISSDGWLSTGDVGYLDDEGRLFLVDRKKELIIRGGYSVYPRELEEVLYSHPAVLEAAVVGVPHETLGEEVVALIVPRRGMAPSAENVQAWTKERVAAYKYPRRVVIVDELPKGPTGKILKRGIDPSLLRS